MPFNSKAASEAGKKSKRGPAKITKERQEKIIKVLGTLDKNINKDLKEMKAVERVNLWKDLQEFIVPKLQRTEAKIEVEGKIELPFNIDLARNKRK